MLIQSKLTDCPQNKLRTKLIINAAKSPRPRPNLSTIPFSLIFLMNLNLLDLLITPMRNKKFNLTSYQPYRSSQLRQNFQKMENGLVQKHSPYKSAFFKRDIIAKTKQTDLQNVLMRRDGIYSLQKLLSQKRKDEKEIREHAKLPNFNIKKFFQKSANKKCNERLQQMSMSSSFTPEARREVTAQPALRRYWERYLNQEITYADLTRELNKNIVEDTQRQRNNQTQFRYSDSNKPQNQTSKIEKSAFYINNFIKTTYRKRRLEHKTHMEVEQTKKQQVKLEEIPKIIKKEVQINPKNWSMVPWQKDNDNQYYEQFNPL